MYQRGCRCLLCRVANARDKAERAARTIPAYVDAGPAAKHLQDLALKGISLTRVSQIIHADRDQLSLIRRGQRKLIRAKLAERILSVQNVRPALGQRINSSQARRQVKWLQTEGFTLREIARRIGKHHLDRRPSITVRFAARIDALFRMMQE